MTVAPKERVNIVYRASVGDAKEDVELPLKTLVIGDFTGRPDDRPLEARDPISVDKDNFNDVMKAQGIQINITVPDRLSAQEDAEMNITLKLESLKDFSPDAIVEAVPELKRLLDLREALRALKGPLANVPAFRRRIQELVSNESARVRLLAEIGIEQ